MASLNLVGILNLILITQTSLCQTTIDIEHIPKNQKEILAATKVLTNEFFNTFGGKRVNLVLITAPDRKYIHNDFLSSIIKISVKNQVIQLGDIRNSFDKAHRCSIVLIDNILEFRDARKLINAESFHSQGFHCFILLEGTLKNVHEILNYFWALQVYNVYFLGYFNGIAVVSFEPYEDPQTCGDTTPKIISRFESGRFTKKFISTKRFENLNKCPVKVTTYTASTATFKETLENGTFVHKGYVATLLRLFAEKLNLTVELQFLDGPGMWGALYANGTATHAFAELMHGYADIIIGSYALREERVKFFDYSVYLTSSVEIVATKASELTAVEKLLFPFQPLVWIYLLLTLVFGCCVIFIINWKFKDLKSFLYGRGVQTPITNMYLTILGIPQPILPGRNFSRYNLTMFVILCFVLRSAYQGGLFQFLQTDQYHKVPQTIQGLIEQNYTYVTTQLWFKLLGDVKKQLLTSTSFVTQDKGYDFDYCLNFKKKSFMRVLREDLLSYSLKNDNFPYIVVNEKLHLENLVMYFKKKYALKNVIDEKIKQIQAAGLLNYWIKEYDRTHRWKHKKKVPRVISFKHIRGAFHILLIGNFVAFLAFLIEIPAKMCKWSAVKYGSMGLFYKCKQYL